MAGFTLSIRRYALLFAAFVTVFCLVLGLLGYHQYRSAVDRIEQAEQDSARQALGTAFDATLGDLSAAADALAGWDELYQQFDNPSYFAYWYANRVLNAVAPDRRFSDLMLYGPQGEALTRIGDSLLPTRIDPDDLQQDFSPLGQDVRMTLFCPLQRKDAGDVRGYLAVQARLRPNLLYQQGLGRIDTDSIHFELKRVTSDPAEVERSIGYRLVPGTDHMIIDDLVRNLILLFGLGVVMPMLMLMYLFNGHLGRAVSELSRVVAALRTRGVSAAQQLIDRDRYFRIRELDVTEQSLIDYQRELLSANATLDEKNRELWDLAHRDSLTGAQNRRAFDTFWKTLQTMNERRPRALRIMLCDVNRFKSINDTYGHDIGDAVLQAIVQCLHRAIRREEQLFRLGGDEFACVLIDCDDQQAMLVASRCEREVANHPFAEELGIQEPVRLSIGISPVAEHGNPSVKEPLRQADVAMYHSKRPVTSSICIYQESLESTSGVVLSSSINEAVYRVIKHGQGLVMHYQPVRDLNTGGVTYYEALLRIDHEDRLIAPVEIMPIVESRHLEKELDQAVIDQLLQDLYSSAIPVGTGVSINLSAVSISDIGIIDRLEPFCQFMADYVLVVEVTETALITQIEFANAHLQELRKRGFRVALDDFGSGYSSLSYLTRMPVDIVKFDIDLIRSLDDEVHRRLVEHLLEFISSAGQDTVAEGVEDENILEWVREIGFGYVQGYLHGGQPELLTPIPRITALP